MQDVFGVLDVVPLVGRDVEVREYERIGLFNHIIGLFQYRRRIPNQIKTRIRIYIKLTNLLLQQPPITLILRLQHQLISIVIDEGNIVSDVAKLADSLVVVKDFFLVLGGVEVLGKIATDENGGDDWEDDELEA